MERHSFRIVSGELPETMRTLCAFPQNFRTMKLNEMAIFYAVFYLTWLIFTNNHLTCGQYFLSSMKVDIATIIMSYNFSLFHRFLQYIDLPC